MNIDGIPILSMRDYFHSLGFEEYLKPLQLNIPMDYSKVYEKTVGGEMMEQEINSITPTEPSNIDVNRAMEISDQTSDQTTGSGLQPGGGIYFGSGLKPGGALKPGGGMHGSGSHGSGMHGGAMGPQKFRKARKMRVRRRSRLTHHMRLDNGGKHEPGIPTHKSSKAVQHLQADVTRLQDPAYRLRQRFR